jgi:glycosyltransferase involved in cell wall biosynthesis
MNIALVTDVFPPMRSSGAVQLRDLSRELVRQGHQVTVLTSAPEQEARWRAEHIHGVNVLRLKAPKTRDRGYIARAIGEFLTPFAMLRNFRASPTRSTRFDGIVWYSPTIFLGPAVRALKERNNCAGYLILRDIFPEWAVDTGIMRRGLAYRFFKAVANFQYSQADTIGVQTGGNLAFLDRHAHRANCRVEVLQNWMTGAPNHGCSIDISATSLAGRKLFVYAGNMGVAQGVGRLIDAAEDLKNETDIGFLLVGRGSEASRLREQARMRGLDNILFFDEIDPDEMTGLYAQCHVGLVMLDPRHRTHNIPGKFISYMHAGLPVLANINSGNDLETLIAGERVGRVSTDPDGRDLGELALAMTAGDLADEETAERCRALARNLFSSESAAMQIVAALQR